MFARRFDQLDAMEKVKSLLKGVSGETISVPSIVVVGAQSSGKSSVLEHATGLAFPRGEGMCTRVPTIVSVEGGADEESLLVSNDPEYKESELTFAMNHDDSEAFGDAIQHLTDHTTKVGQIGEAPIYVKFARKTGLTFTLTDVPGITCNSKTCKGSDIEKQTTDLTRKMIGMSADTLVLVVLPATDDFDNSKALQLAMELDPRGDRTIGVVTKIDNLPPGSEIVKHMSGDSIYLRHGFFAVRNRTQKEINEGMGMDDLEHEEAELFITDEVLSELPEEQRGMPRLLDKVASEQGKRLDQRIPALRREIQDRIIKATKAIAGLPEPMADDAARAKFLNRKLARIESDFRRCVESDTSVLGSACKETNLAARVHEVTVALGDNTRAQQPSFLSGDVESQLRNANKEGLGYDLSNFMQGTVFRSVFHDAVAPVFVAEAATAAEATHKCVIACFDALVDHHLGDGVTLAIRAAVKQHFGDVLNRTVADATKFINQLHKDEASVCHTDNHYYMQTISKFDEKVAQHSHEWKNDKGTHGHGCALEDLPEDFMHTVALDFKNTRSNDALAIRTMQISLYAYGKVVNKRFTDYVGVVLKSRVLMGTANTLTDEVINWSTALQSKVQEDPALAHKRVTLTNDVQRLEKALAVLTAL